MTTDAASGTASDVESAVAGDVGDKIGDLRAHLCHAHPLRPEWVDVLPPAELAALHRRLHGRAVEPEPSLVGVRLIELWTDPASRATTALPLDDATRDEDPLVWMPLRVADLVHHGDAPGHTAKGGCRACADVIEATIRAVIELDSTPHRTIAALEQERDRLTGAVDALLHALAMAPGALLALAKWAALLDGDESDSDDLVDYDRPAIEDARSAAQEHLDRFLRVALEAGNLVHGGGDGPDTSG